MTASLKSLLFQELEEFREEGLLRKIRTLSNHRGARAQWEGRELLLFSGNDYLGLSRDIRVIQAAATALQEQGVGSGAARLISGTTNVHTRLEEELARFKKKEAALLFGSGYLANVGVLGALAGKKDLIVMDKLCHASLIDGARLSGATLRIFPHRRYAQCEKILEKGTHLSKRILVSDSIFSMDGDRADLAELIRLKEKYDCLLVVDDAHGIGVYGPEGRGATEGVEEKIDVIVGTLSKAFGVFGGFALGDRVLIDHLINFSRAFIFATAPPPALSAAALESLRLIEEEGSSLRKRLWLNVDRVLEFVRRKGFQIENRSPIIPLMVGKEEQALQLSNQLLEKGILVPAIRYPTVPRGRARLRLTVSAAHSDKDLEQLFQAL